MHVKNIFLIFLFVSSGILYYYFTQEDIVAKTTTIIQVIDGDTLKTSDNETIRLLGINTPERNQPLYEEARNELNKTVAFQQVRLISFGKDKYERTLGYIVKNEILVNAQLLEQGFATLYVYEKDKYYDTLAQAEKYARTNELGLWKKSPNASCLLLKKFQFKEPNKRCTNGEIITLENLCDKTVTITIKDDATHIYEETISPKATLEQNFSCIFNDAGDSLYVYDEKGLLLFERY